jgi:hypothetical protein
VITNVREAFLDESVDEQVLQELKQVSVCACAKLCIEKKAHGTNQNIDGFYTKTTQKGGFSKLCLKNKKKDVIPTNSIFQHVSII